MRPSKAQLPHYHGDCFINADHWSVLHPRYKTGYMRDNDWDEEDIDSAKQDVRDVYEAYRTSFRLTRVAMINFHSQISSKSSKSSNINLFDKMELDDDAATAIAAEAIDELDLYLTEPRVKGITDVLRWWALNTATSVYVERQFSRGRLLVSSVRNRLSAQSIRELMCLGCWSRQGFVEEDDFKVVAQLPTVEEEGEDGTDQE
ncbi:hypothetical protein FB451DRAFT_1190768 [Mycena latifolia]|nr:hypothetical protein FB451DRAFT_1190768 [Mycena latifolia]